MSNTVSARASYLRGWAPGIGASIADDRPAPPELRLFQRAMESSACPIVIINGGARQTVVYASPAFLSLVGYTKAELSGREWWQLFCSTAGESRPEAFRVAMHSGSEAHGTLCTTHKNGTTRYFDAKTAPLRNDFGAITHHVAVLHDVTSERRVRETLEFRAHHDPLTGLANRHLLADSFRQAAAHALRHDAALAVIVLDLNGFKEINDQYGHDRGDALLKCFATRLRDAVRAEDTVARLGGDEFALLITDAGASSSTQHVLERIAESLRQPIELDERARATISCCSGIARFPHDGTDLETLLKAADVQLYEGKSRRRRL